MIIGLLIWVVIIGWIGYKLYKIFSPAERECRRREKVEKLNLKERLSHEETSCCACNRTGTKDKMKIYKIKVRETNLGTYTENVLGGLGGSRHLTRKRIEFYEGYICKKCELNWEIACLVWIGVMIIGEFCTYIVYRLLFEPNTDTAVMCFSIGTVVSFVFARYCWIAYRKKKQCHIKVID